MEQQRVVSRFYEVSDIMALIGCSRSHAYGLIRKWNTELTAKGYTVARYGMVVKAYADLKLGLNIVDKEEVCNV